MKKLFDSLSSEEAQILRLMLSKFDDATGQTLIETLIDLPRAERGRKLRELLMRFARG